MVVMVEQAEMCTSKRLHCFVRCAVLVIIIVLEMDFLEAVTSVMGVREQIAL
jgi:hypothetical protein